MGDRRLHGVDRGRPVTLEFDGQPVRGWSGESVAVALHASRPGPLGRSLKYHRPRGPFCLEGHCGGCLMRIGGVPNLRACMEPCADGLQLAGQNAYPSVDHDALGAVDWLFGRGMDHHTLMTGARVLNAVAGKVVRQLSGLGTLPARTAPPAATAERLEVDVVVIGGGPAGLAAATTTARAGLGTALFDEHDAPGGSLLAEPHGGPEAAAAATAAARAAGVAITTGATAIGRFPDDGGVLAVATAERLIRVTARASVYATGGYAQNRRFENNDRPGVLAARAVGRMLARHGVVAGDRPVVVGDDAYAVQLAAALARHGAAVVRVDGVGERLVAVEGGGWVERAIVESAGGARRAVPCDVVAVSAPAAPASELVRQHGGAVELRPAAGGFVARVDDGGRAAPGAWACGDVTGYVGPTAAAVDGARVGAEVARALAEAP